MCTILAVGHSVLAKAIFENTATHTAKNNFNFIIQVNFFKVYFSFLPHIHGVSSTISLAIKINGV
jgi:hypothetical protein